MPVISTRRVGKSGREYVLWWSPADVLVCCCPQDDVDVYRSFANMLPGGFSVGSTTGWLNNTEPEFLRRAAFVCYSDDLMRAALTHAVRSRYRVNITQKAFYFLSVR